VSGAGLRILLVEDDAIIGMLLEDMLLDMGHTVNGVERTRAGAVAAALSRRPDLMIVDARLGSESGVAAVAEIQRSWSVPHVFISGGPVLTSVANAVIVQKPFGLLELQSAIERALALPAEKKPLLS
jgi:DNA-binding NtrC family response regulator